jgi:hypothetical protein
METEVHFERGGPGRLRMVIDKVVVHTHLGDALVPTRASDAERAECWPGMVDHWTTTDQYQHNLEYADAVRQILSARRVWVKA